MSLFSQGLPLQQKALGFLSQSRNKPCLKEIVFLLIIYGMNNYFILQLKLLHPVQCMAFAKLSLFKAKHNPAFSARVYLGACDRAVEEEILFKIQEIFGDFCTVKTFSDVLLCGMAKVGEALWE